MDRFGPVIQLLLMSPAHGTMLPLNCEDAEDESDESIDGMEAGEAWGCAGSPSKATCACEALVAR